jgi:hypothetical protein
MIGITLKKEENEEADDGLTKDNGTKVACRHDPIVIRD